MANRKLEYFKLDAELYEAAVTLPPAQAGKFLFAACKLFFENEEVDGLPRRAADIWIGWEPRIRQKRKAAIAPKGAKGKTPSNAPVQNNIFYNSESKIYDNQDNSESKMCGNLTASDSSTSKNDACTCVRSEPDSGHYLHPDKREENTSSSEAVAVESSMHAITIPSLDEVVRFCEHERLSIDPVRFFTLNESRDWHTSTGKPVTDWQGLARTWNKHERQPVNHAPVGEAGVGGGARDVPSVEEIMRLYQVDRDKAEDMIREGLY